MLRSLIPFLRQHWLLLWITFIMQSVIASIVGKGIMTDLDTLLKHTTQYHVLDEGYNRTVIGDLLNQFPNLISSIGSTFTLSIILYLVYHFVIGNYMLVSLKNGKLVSKENTSDYLKHFFSLFLISLMGIIVNMMIVFIGVFLIQNLLGKIENFTTEEPIFYGILTIAILASILILLVWVWVLYIKKEYLNNGLGLIRSIKLGSKSALKNGRNFTKVIFTLNIIFYLSIFTINYLPKIFGLQTVTVSLIIFFAIQIVLFIKYLVKWFITFKVVKS